MPGPGRYHNKATVLLTKEVAMRILVCALIAGLLVSPAMAAEKKAGCPMAMGQGMGPGQGMDAMEKMHKSLELSEEQAAKLKGLREKNREAIKPLRRELQDQTVQLKRLLEDKASDSKVEAQLKALRAAQKKIEAERDKHLADIEAILTPTQRAKFLLKMGRRYGRCMDCPMGQKRGMGQKPGMGQKREGK